MLRPVLAELSNGLIGGDEQFRGAVAASDRVKQFIDVTLDGLSKLALVDVVDGDDLICTDVELFLQPIAFTGLLAQNVFELGAVDGKYPTLEL